MPRKTAFTILLKIEKDKAYSNIALSEIMKDYNLKPEDRRLVSALVYGVIERKLTLDYNLSLYLSQPIKKLKKDVLTCLRLGAYQIFYMDKIPAFSAVDESVKLSKKFRFAYASGMINAVLRKCTVGLQLPDSLGVKYSCGEDVLNVLLRDYGEIETEKILASAFDASPVTVRVNTLKTDSDKLIKILSDEGIEAEKTFVKNALVLHTNGKNPTFLKSYKSGMFHLQGIASQLCAESLGAQKGNIVYDMCAAPGGKSFTIAELMGNEGQLHSFELHPHRVQLIQNGAKRLGLSIISAEQNNAEAFREDLGFADCILCDVPCSGLGTIKSKPEIKYKNAEEIGALLSVQSRILQTSSRYLKCGGRLVYSTCTINKDENERIVEAFLSQNTDFTLETMKTFLPHIDGCDGFFIAVITKKYG